MNCGEIIEERKILTTKIVKITKVPTAVIKLKK